MTRFQALISTIFITLTASASFAQERCGTVVYEKSIHPSRETETQFEEWMQLKIAGNRLSTFKTGKTQSTYTIPVVVHIIHNGETVGTGSNISDAQIASQIQVINKDYQRLNADQTNTPAEFLPFAQSIDIQFVLARQDPEGRPTNGITRTQGTKTSWTIYDNSEFKSLNYWPAENYLNIWVLNLAGGFIGYAQLPISSTLSGLDNPSTDRLTDGVSIYYKAFGSIDDGAFTLDPLYNKGRTATHEIGHTFGLRHIWGDGTCATDYCNDTPPQSSATTGCPSNPQTSCDVTQPHKMFQNYMDYSSDVCMNIFTQNQVDRMNVVIQNSPRRASLLTSPGATTPVLVADDLGIRSILTPSSAECNNPAVPKIEVRNYGTNPITSAQVQLSVNGTPQETKTFNSLNLNSDALTTLSFSPLNFVPGTAEQVSFQILTTNSTTDGKSSNNSALVQVNVPTSIALPFTEPFNTLPGGWSVLNPDTQITWANKTAPDNSPTNRAMYMDFIDDDDFGNIDWLITPFFSTTTPLSTQLRFDIAYSYTSQFPNDGLKVYALPGCNPDLSQAILLYSKSGSALATVPSYISSFVPNSNAQWRKSEVVSLSSLTSGNWQLAFIGNNGAGNNLYVDNVNINDQVINDLGISSIVSPGIIQCKIAPALQISLKNFSTSSVTSFQAQVSINGGAATTQTINNISIPVGGEQTFTLNALNLSNGSNQLTVSVSLPNGLPDSAPANNSITTTSFVDQTSDGSPLRQNFDDPIDIPWIAVQTNAKPWQLATTNKGKSMMYPAYTNTTISEEAWLASPVLDLSRYSQQSLFFDLSYARRNTGDDHLRIVASEDCGLTYKWVLFDEAGSLFAIRTTNSPWVPSVDSSWKKQYVTLDSIAGKSDIRLAFIATNANGNNIYIDNIEIFAGDNVSPPITTQAYELYYSTQNSQSDLALTFNLPQKQDVRLQIFTLMGQVVADNILPDTLNQTYYFDMSLQSAGIYLFRLQFQNQISTTKVFIGH